MDGISRILVAVDGSENADRAFEYGVYMAKRFEAEQLLMINVIEAFGPIIREIESHDAFFKDLRHNSKQLLEKYKSKAYSQAFTTLKVISAAGNTAEEILRAVEKEDVDMIAIDHRGLSTTSELLLGSVSLNIIHHAKCPVVMVT
jgi:nucleotide-binding universal stress UspA family protein